jgi:hypothetical protein
VGGQLDHSGVGVLHRGRAGCSGASR